MARRKSASETVPIGSMERYEVVEIHRSELKAAPYNPRMLSDAARKKLQQALKKHGLISPPTWNARTGHIVGGHQRVAALDAAYGTDNYTLKVARVDMDDAQEKAANLVLNNFHAQGEFDLAKLEQLFRDTPEIDISGTGFDGADLFRLFGASPFESRADDELSDVAQRVRDAREKQAKIRGAVKEREGTHFYLVVIFKDEADRLEFTDACGLEDNRWQSGDHFKLIAADWIRKRKEIGADEAVSNDGDED